MFNFKKPELKGLFTLKKYEPERNIVINQNDLDKILREYLRQQGVKVPQRARFWIFDSVCSFSPRAYFSWKGDED